LPVQRIEDSQEENDDEDIQRMTKS
jgi:hypothetical protein